MILLIAPEMGHPHSYIDAYCRRERIENPVVEEIEPRGGCRRFRVVRCSVETPDASSPASDQTAPQGQA